MILSKIKNLVLLVSLVVLFGQCANDKPNPKIKQLTKNIVIHSPDANYSINNKQVTDSTILLSFKYKSPYPVNMGDFFHFYVKNPFFVNKISMVDKKKQSPLTAYYFKLYVNNKYIGKYKTMETIMLNKKIASINILFLKTSNEHIAEGWKGNTILKLVRQDSKTNTFKPQIDLLINNKQKIKFQTAYSRPIRNKKTVRLNQVFVKKHFTGNQFHATGFYQDKNSTIITQYSLYFDKNGKFQIYQIISEKFDKKLISEIFFTGNWTCTGFYGNQAKLILVGNYSGYLAGKKEPIVNNKYFRIKSTLKGIELKSDKSLAKFYFDFPNDALVNTKSLIPDVMVDMPYAGTNNFTGIRLYSCNKCFLRYEVAKALMNVQVKLKKRQMGLKLFDGYRPFSVQAVMFKKFPVPGYVADSIGGSVHNRGSAVDLTIIDRTGKELDMGTGFDELSRKANHTYLLFPDTVLKNRIFLKELMQSCNFSPIRSEWWHYNYVDGRKFPKIDEPFLCD